MNPQQAFYAWNWFAWRGMNQAEVKPGEYELTKNDDGSYSATWDHWLGGQQTTHFSAADVEMFMAELEALA